jgi:hypothetical protein
VISLGAVERDEPRSTGPPNGNRVHDARSGSNSMADDSNLRSHRSNESRASAPGSDPLAELARLIGQNDPFADFGREPRKHAAAPDWRTEGAADDRYARPADAGEHDHQSYADQRPSEHGYQAGADDHAQHEDHYAADERDESELQREEIYDDPPRARRRAGSITVMVVVALAVVGTAGVFGYRAISGGYGPTTPPPVIKADTNPSKIVPAVQSTDQQSSKLIQDRVGSSQGERIVSREEQPVDLREARPRVVFPPLNTPNTASVPAAASPFPPVPPPAASINEPKKIRTVTIRPEQPDPSARTPARSANASASESPFPPPARPAPAAPAASPRSGPLSLAPQASPPEQPALAPSRQTRTASAPNPPAQAAAASGSYVQVSSQRSETDAQASFKALQGKYPNVLGGKQVVIRRAELGDKGVYYRAMVGPFASIEQATELCSSLKAAGGQCVVQRN